MNKPFYLGLPILEISKIVIYKFWYDYVKPKYGDLAKLCYTNTDSFIVYIKAEDIYSDIPKDVQKGFHTSKRKNRKVIELMKDQLGGKIMTEAENVLRPKKYSYLTNDNDENKKAKDTKMCVIKRNLKLEDYKYCFKI